MLKALNNANYINNNSSLVVAIRSLYSQIIEKGNSCQMAKDARGYFDFTSPPYREKIGVLKQILYV